LLAALSSFTALIPAISMFLYRKRMLQMRFNIFNSILLVALQGFIIYYIVSYITQETRFVFTVQSVFPVISLILSILSIRNILKDELLIQSLKRIR
jgi:heme A synthase